MLVNTGPGVWNRLCRVTMDYHVQLSKSMADCGLYHANDCWYWQKSNNLSPHIGKRERVISSKFVPIGYISYLLSQFKKRTIPLAKKGWLFDFSNF